MPDALVSDHVDERRFPCRQRPGKSWKELLGVLNTLSVAAQFLSNPVVADPWQHVEGICSPRSMGIWSKLGPHELLFQRMATTGT